MSKIEGSSKTKIELRQVNVRINMVPITSAFPYSNLNIVESTIKHIGIVIMINKVAPSGFSYYWQVSSKY